MRLRMSIGELQLPLSCPRFAQTSPLLLLLLTQRSPIWLCCITQLLCSPRTTGEHANAAQREQVFLSDPLKDCRPQQWTSPRLQAGRSFDGLGERHLLVDSGCATVQLFGLQLELEVEVLRAQIRFDWPARETTGRRATMAGLTQERVERG